MLDGDVISPEGREMVEKMIQKLSEDDRVALVTSDLWSTLESERAYEPELDIKMDLIDSGSPGGWEELSNWLLSTDKDET